MSVFNAASNVFTPARDEATIHQKMAVVLLDCLARTPATPLPLTLETLRDAEQNFRPALPESMTARYRARGT